MTKRTSLFFFFNDAATTEIYTLSLHDALPICSLLWGRSRRGATDRRSSAPVRSARSASPTSGGRSSSGSNRSTTDRKSTRLNSSHVAISYAVFCLKKKKKQDTPPLQPRP